MGVYILLKELFSFLYNELSVFIYEYSLKIWSIRYGYFVGLYDDTVMSFVLCNYNRKKNRSYGIYVVR